MNRVLIKRTYPDWTFEQFAEDRDEHWNGALIKRRYDDGLVEWFDIHHRSPSEDDLVDLAVAASLQTGFAIHWLLIDSAAVQTILNGQRFLSKRCTQTASEELKRCVTSWPNTWEQSSDTALQLGVSCWDDACKVRGIRDYHQLWQTAHTLFPPDSNLHCWFEMGDQLGNGLVDKRLSIELDPLSLSEFPTVDNSRPRAAEVFGLFTPNLQVPVDLAAASKERVWMLLNCDLFEPSASFQETISNLDEEEKEWQRSRVPRGVHEEQFVPNARQRLILEALDGEAKRVDDLEAVTGDRRALYDRKYPDGTIKTQGDLTQLHRLGKVEQHRRLGYYRPDSPPPELAGER